MRRTPKRFLPPAVCVALVLAFAVAAIGKKKSAFPAVNEHQRAVHVLNRFAFGPRPGDVDRVTATGADKWFEQQLRPDQIDDSGLESRLAPLRTLRMDTRAIVENFPPPQVLKAIADGREPMPRDPVKRAIYEAQMVRYQEKQDLKQTAANASSSQSDPVAQAPTDTKDANYATAHRRESKLYADLKAEDLLNLPPDQRMKEILKMPPDEERALFAGKSEQKDALLQSMTPEQRETAMALAILSRL